MGIVSVGDVVDGRWIIILQSKILFFLLDEVVCCLDDERETFL